MQIAPTNYASAGYNALAGAIIANAKSTNGGAPQSSGDSPAATTITLSEAARAALQVKSIAIVVAEARTKLDGLLKTANRTSPLKDARLAVDLSALDQREIFAIATNKDNTFTQDEQDAAALEMQRRFEAALSGPAAVAKVTGSVVGLYKAAADYFETLGAEEKSEPDMIAARAAVADAQKQLAIDPNAKPSANEDDPVALYLRLVEAKQISADRPVADIAADARSTLDRAYAAIKAKGLVPVLDSSRKSGEFVDISALDSRSVATIALNTDSKFSDEEVRIAKSAIKSRSGAALLAGLNNAQRSDPTAFSKNVISLYSSMSAEERLAAGWSPQFYDNAVQNYESTSKLMNMFADIGGGKDSFSSWFGK